MRKVKEIFDKVKSNKKMTIITFGLLITLILAGGGVTYSLFNYTNDNAGNNDINSGHISMTYTEPSNEYVVENALPIKDAEGVASTDYFEFSITTTAKTNSDDDNGVTIPYEITITESEENTLTSDKIKIYVTEVEGENEIGNSYVSPMLASDFEPSLYKNVGTKVGFNVHLHRNGNETITTKYRLRAWVDYDVDVSDWDTAGEFIYKFRVNVNGEATYQGYTTDQSCFAYEELDDGTYAINGFDFNKCDSKNIVVPKDYKKLNNYKEIKSINWPNDDEFLVAYKNMYFNQSCSGYDSLALCLDAKGIAEADFEAEAVNTYNTQYKTEYNELIGLNYYDYEDAIEELITTALSLGLTVEFVYGEDEINVDYIKISKINSFDNTVVAAISNSKNTVINDLNNVVKDKKNYLSNIADQVYAINAIIIPEEIIIKDKAFLNLNINQIYDTTGKFPSSCFGYEELDDNITINSYVCDGIKKVVIPSNIKGLSVKTIGVSSFENAKLEKLIISNGIETIENYAFRYNNFKNLILPNSVIKIGGASFSEGAIENLILSKNLEEIGTSAFDGNNIKNLNIPEKIVSISDYAFESNKIKELVIPETVKKIGVRSFNNNELKELYIESDGIELDERSFGGQNIDYVKIVNTLVNDSLYEAFSHIEKFEDINEKFPDWCFLTDNVDGELSIKDYLCFYAKNPIIPDEIDDYPVTVIQNSSFKNADSNKYINGITIGNNIRVIEYRGLYGNNFTTIVVPESVEEIGNEAFKNRSVSPYHGVSKVINKTGKAFDWEAIIYGTTGGESFVTGDISHRRFGDVKVVAQ